MEFPPIRILEGMGHLPIPFQIKNNIKHAISSGHLQPNAQLPSVRDLASQLDVAANTVARAYKELQDEELLVTYAGRGTFVADLVQNRNLVSEHETLQEILRPAVSSARAIGYEEEQIIQVVQELFSAQGIQVGLIGINLTIIQKWKHILEQEFADLGVEVTALTVAELQENPTSALAHLSSAYYIFSLITTYPETRQLFHDHSKKVVALITEVSMRTHQLLASLPREETIGLVCEDMYVNSLMGLIEPYVEHERIARVSPEDAVALQELLDQTKYVLHTLSPKEFLMRQARPGQQLVEIEFLPSRSCFHQIRQMLIKDRQKDEQPA
jgi:GntR family transcriptional regulator